MMKKAFEDHKPSSQQILDWLKIELNYWNNVEPLLKSPSSESSSKTSSAPIALHWKKNSALLAYLLNELKTLGFIDDKDIWKISEAIFRDKAGNKIKHTAFTSMVKNYENNQTPDGSKGNPKHHADITPDN